MEFGLLGPLTVTCDGQQMAVSQGNQRTVLAALLMNPNQLVSADQLIEAIWPGDPPPAARVTMQNYVKRLRASLGAVGHTRIITRPSGYGIVATEAEIDISNFRRLTRHGLAAARRQMWTEATENLSGALATWRGPAFADVPSELLARTYRPGLDALRWHAAEARMNAELKLGRHQDAIAELLQLVAVDPLRERLHELLMLALYRDGQRAAALQAYRRVRNILTTEVGIEPGLALRDLHQRILQEDPTV